MVEEVEARIIIMNVVVVAMPSFPVSKLVQSNVVVAVQRLHVVVVEEDAVVVDEVGVVVQ